MANNQPQSAAPVKKTTGFEPVSRSRTPPQSNPLSLAQRALATPPAELKPGAILALQRTVGNRAVNRLVSGQKHVPLQPRLRLGPVHDPYEQEADQVAREVVQRLRRPQAAQPTQPPSAADSTARALVQRQTTGSADQTLSPQLENKLQPARGAGQPLATGTQSTMETAFGADFSDVRIHTDSQSHNLNETLQARAFTTGSDIFFRQGEYHPGSSAGQELLAHELTHVVQQNGAAPVIQAKGFKKVNGAEPNIEDPQTGGLVQAGLAAWDMIFGDNTRIDEQGGIVSVHKPGAGELDADTDTVPEEPAEPIPFGAFARVTTEGGLAGTHIKRWHQTQRPGDKVRLPTNVLNQNQQTIKTAIAQALFGDGPYTESEPPKDEETVGDWLLFNLQEEDKDIVVWAKTNPKERGWLVQAFLEHLEAKAAFYQGEIPRDVFGLLHDSCKAVSSLIMTNLQNQLNLPTVIETVYEPGQVTLPLKEVLAHEFGHVATALQSDPKQVKEDTLQLPPTFGSVKKVILELRQGTDVGQFKTPPRARITQLRFVWGQVHTAFYKSREYELGNKNLESAIRLLLNVLMSFEEYYNIEAVDNTLIPGSNQNKRLSHGTEIVLLHQLGVPQPENLDQHFADRVGALDPATAAKYVWISKLDLILRSFIQKFQDFLG